MNEKTISFITKAGIVIITTLASFIVSPPVLTPPGDVVNWKNVFTFFAGILSIVLINQFKNYKKQKTLSLILLFGLVLFIVVYQFIYTTYSVDCFEMRCVISHSPVKEVMLSKWEFWRTQPDSTQKFLEANQCEPLKIWDASNLHIQYYSMIIIYFIIIVLLTMLLVLVADIIQKKKLHVPEKNNLSIFFFSALFFPASCFGQTDISDTQLKNMIETQFNKLREPAKVLNIDLGSIVYTDAPSSHANRDDNNIAINIAEIKKYISNGTTEFREMFIKLILGHEIGHKLQFNSYRKEVISKSKGESTIFLECYADILSGFILTQVMNGTEFPEELKKNPGLDIQKYKDDISTTIFNVFKRVIEMDKENVDFRTHPDNDQRIMAIRQGLLIGNCVFTFFLLNSNDPSIQLMKPDEVQKLRTLYTTISKAIGFNPYDQNNNNPISWMHAEAIRIIHETNSMAKNLIIYDQKIKWNTSADNPIVDYSFSIVNRNPTAVQFAGRVVTELNLRKDRKNIIKNMPVDSYAFDRIIKPNETISITGRLTWVADNDYMPLIILPGFARSLYWVFDKENPMPDQNGMEIFESNFTHWNSSTADGVTDLLNYVLGKKRTLFNCTKGIGNSNESELNKALSNPVYYDVLFANETDSKQQIYMVPATSEISYHCTVLSNADKDMAQEHFNELIAKISSSLPRYKSKRPALNDDTNSVDYYDSGELAFSISLSKVIEGIYDIDLDIYGIK